MSALKNLEKVSARTKNAKYTNGIPTGQAERLEFFKAELAKVSLPKRFESISTFTLKRTQQLVLESVMTVKPQVLWKITSMNKYLKTMLIQKLENEAFDPINEDDFVNMCLSFKKEKISRTSGPTKDAEDLFFECVTDLVRFYRKNPTDLRFANRKYVKNLFETSLKNLVRLDFRNSCATKKRNPVNLDLALLDWELHENTLTPLERIASARINTKLLSLMRQATPEDSKIIGLILATFSGESEDKISHDIRKSGLTEASYHSKVREIFARFPEIKEELEYTSLNKSTRCDGISISVLGFHDYSKSVMTKTEDESKAPKTEVSYKSEPCYRFKHNDGKYTGTVEATINGENVIVKSPAMDSINDAKAYLKSEITALTNRSMFKVA